jgi:hypothetical protein
LLNIDERIEGSAVGKQEWIKFKRLSKLDNAQDVEDMLYDMGASLVNQYPFQVTLKIAKLEEFKLAFMELFIIEMRIYGISEFQRERPG